MRTIGERGWRLRQNARRPAEPTPTIPSLCCASGSRGWWVQPHVAIVCKVVSPRGSLAQTDFSFPPPCIRGGFDLPALRDFHGRKHVIKGCRCYEIRPYRLCLNVKPLFARDFVKRPVGNPHQVSIEARIMMCAVFCPD